MPRQPRFYFPGCVLHIVQRGIDRTAIFRADRDRRHYLDCLRLAAIKHRTSIHAYVLMSNHVHLLVSPGDEFSAPRLMQMLGRRFVAWFNARYRRTGSLWEGRYKATLVDTDAYLFACMRYIELNPVRAGIAERPVDYRWSSYHANASGFPDPLITPHPAYAELAEQKAARWRAYRIGFDAVLEPRELEAIRDATQYEWGLGDAGFRARVQALTGRRAERLSRGRPPRDRRGGRIVGHDDPSSPAKSSSPEVVSDPI